MSDKRDSSEYNPMAEQVSSFDDVNQDEPIAMPLTET